MTEAYVHVTVEDRKHREAISEFRKYDEIKNSVSVIGGYGDGLLLNVKTNNNEELERVLSRIKKSPYVSKISNWFVVEL
jgi:hypothetical protein